MITFKAEKGWNLYYILATFILYEILILLGLKLSDSYILSLLLKILFAVTTIYQLYYIIVFISVSYKFDDENVYITSLLRKITIPIKTIEGYKIESGKIQGIRLSGVGTNSFALGRFVVKKIGTTHMYVTGNHKLLYIKAGDNNFAISPVRIEDITKVLNENNINSIEWEHEWGKAIHLHKEKSFMLPFIINSVIVSFITLNPFVLYLMNKLPDKMPLSFDASFFPVDFGSGKQFAFNQMIYGVLNMAVLFCMYYAAHFYAKYDKRMANRFIYISLLIAAAFLLIQIRILML
jgi:hypothetical protein